MSIYYKQFITNEQNYINKGSKKIRIDILRFLIQHNITIHEASDGIRVDLNLIDESTLKEFYLFVCHKLGINIEQLYNNTNI
jgi:hypothetical protein